MCPLCLSQCLSVSIWVSLCLLVSPCVFSVSQCLSVSLSFSVCLSVSLSVSVSLSFYLCLSVSLCFSQFLSVSLSVSLCLSVLLSVYLCVSLFLSVSLSVFLCVSVCLCVSMMCQQVCCPHSETWGLQGPLVKNTTQSLDHRQVSCQEGFYKSFGLVYWLVHNNYHIDSKIINVFI